MSNEAVLLLVLDLTGTFAFALNGALTGVRTTRLDIVGVVTLGVITAMGGGVIRDILLGSLPPATFQDWRYLTVAVAGALIAFTLSRWLDRLAGPILVLDAVGLSIFAVTGAGASLAVGLGAGQAVILGAVTGVGGGTIRDMLIGQVPTILHSELYAIPALVGAALAVAAAGIGIFGLAATLSAAAVCFVIRMVGVRYRLNAPPPPGTTSPS